MIDKSSDRMITNFIIWQEYFPCIFQHHHHYRHRHHQQQHQYHHHHHHHHLLTSTNSCTMHSIHQSTTNEGLNEKWKSSHFWNQRALAGNSIYNNGRPLSFPGGRSFIPSFILHSFIHPSFLHSSFIPSFILHSFIHPSFLRSPFIPSFIFHSTFFIIHHSFFHSAFTLSLSCFSFFFWLPTLDLLT